MSEPAKYIMLPGIGGSGKAHWQSIWERNSNEFLRFSPTSWDEPSLEDWIVAVDRAVSESIVMPVVIAHSLSCLLVAHWANQRGVRIRGALLVCVPDPASPIFPAAAKSFREPPRTKLPFHSLVVSSADDPYTNLKFVRAIAKDWGAPVIDAGAHGHLGESAGVGHWEMGTQIFHDFLNDIEMSQ